MSIDALIAACYARACAPPPVGSGGSIGRAVATKAGHLGLLTSHGKQIGLNKPPANGASAAMRNPLGAARNAAGASGVEHLIKQSQGHPAQRYIQKAHEAFRDAHRQGIGQDNSSAVDHAAGMKALRQAHAVAKAASPKGTLQGAIKTAIDKKNTTTGPGHVAKTPAGATRTRGDGSLLPQSRIRGIAAEKATRMNAKAARAEARTAQSSAKVKTRSGGGMKLDQASRDIAASKGFAMGGQYKGKFPIRNAGELRSAVRLLPFTKVPRAAVVSHIRAQATRLGLPIPPSVAASAFTRAEFLTAAEEFYNKTYA